MGKGLLTKVAIDNEYRVRLDGFEGPFDLLVYLIERAEMNVYDIQISEIITQYMEHVKHIQRIDPVAAGEFMVLASSLMEIKSRMLLPITKQEEITEVYEDPRDELVQRILEYKKYKAASELLGKRAEQMEEIFCKPMEDPATYSCGEDIIISLDIKQFMNAFEIFLHKRRKLDDVKNHYARARIRQMSIETRIEQMKGLFNNKKKFLFAELLGEEKNRYNIALTFLTVLELMKHKTVRVRQNVNFGEILITVNPTEE